MLALELLRGGQAVQVWAAVVASASRLRCGLKHSIREISMTILQAQGTGKASLDTGSQ